jgi:antitoxin HigA-1
MARPAIHPGEILADELQEIGVTPTELSRQIDVPANRITQIIHGRRGITGDTALRLGHWFGTSAQFWLNLQSAYDIRVARAKAGREIAKLPVRRDAGIGTAQNP